MVYISHICKALVTKTISCDFLPWVGLFLGWSLCWLPGNFIMMFYRECKNIYFFYFRNLSTTTMFCLLVVFLFLSFLFMIGGELSRFSLTWELRQDSFLAVSCCIHSGNQVKAYWKDFI